MGDKKSLFVRRSITESAIVWQWQTQPIKGSSLLLTLDRYYIHVFIAFLFFTFISFHVLTLSSWWCNTAFI